MEEQRYPIGEQDFKLLREYGFIYVDKTAYIQRMLKNRFYFLSRPRRFGKSLFLSTLEQFFLGNKEIFNGLSIENYNWDWQQYPVIKISFGQGNFYEADGLKSRLNQILFYLEEDYGFEPRFEKFSDRFSDLVKRIFNKYQKQVVILIDEYEKPLLDSYDTDSFENNRKELASFYSVFKDNVDKIRFLFITGVTRFGQLNIFSGLNNLLDISLDSEYEAICGLTEEEIKRYFSTGIANFARENETTEGNAFSLLKKYYDGYHFSRDLTDVYNPWSVINCLHSARLKSDWFTSGSPAYLLKILRKKNYDLTKLLGSSASESQLLGTGVDVMDPTALLYQSGYLTIKNYERVNDNYEIGLPNFEVRTALLEIVIPFYLGKNEQLERNDIIRLFSYLENGDAEKMMQWLAAYFSKISFYSKINFERDFHVIVLGIFLLIKDFKDVHCEYAMSSGRTDLVMETNRYVYIFEFKIGEDAGKALEQINFRGYELPWSADGRKVIKIGAAFSTKNNGILRYRIEE